MRFTEALNSAFDFNFLSYILCGFESSPQLVDDFFHWRCSIVLFSTNYTMYWMYFNFFEQCMISMIHHLALCSINISYVLILKVLCISMNFFYLYSSICLKPFVHLQVTTYHVYIALQNECNVTVTESRQHQLSPDSSSPAQILTLRVDSINPAIRHFDIRCVFRSSNSTVVLHVQCQTKALFHCFQA